MRKSRSRACAHALLRDFEGLHHHWYKRRIGQRVLIRLLRNEADDIVELGGASDNRKGLRKGLVGLAVWPRGDRDGVGAVCMLDGERGEAHRLIFGRLLSHPLLDREPLSRHHSYVKEIANEEDLGAVR